MEPQCPVCYDDYNTSDTKRCLVLCKDGHITCLKCLKGIMRRSYGLQDNQEKCWLCENTTHNYDHFSCPMCRDVFHLPQGRDVNDLAKLPENVETLKRLLEDRRDIRRHIIKYRPGFDGLKRILFHLKSLCDWMIVRIRIGNITGAGITILGQAMFLGGSALAISDATQAFGFMKFSAIVAGFGGFIAGVLPIFDYLHMKTIQGKVEDRLIEYNMTNTDQDNSRGAQVLSLRNPFILFKVIRVLLSLGVITGSATVLSMLYSLIPQEGKDISSAIFTDATTASQIKLGCGMGLAGVLLLVEVSAIVWNWLDLKQKRPSMYSNHIQKELNCINKITDNGSLETEKVLNKIDDITFR